MSEAAFEELYEKNARPLWAYLSRIGGSSALADDFLQETFFRYLRAPVSAGGDEGAARAYLFKIATNLVYDHFRRVQRENKWRLFSAEQADRRFAYDNFAEETEMAQVFAQLKPQERALLWLAYVEGYEHREIAEVLGLNALSIRVLLYRARRRLAGLLGSRQGEIK